MTLEFIPEGGGSSGGSALPGTTVGLLPPGGQTDKLALLEAAIGKPVPLAYGLHLVGGNVILNEEVANGERVVFTALGEGEWDGIEALFVNGKLYDHTDTASVHFHPGLDGETGTESDPTVRNQKICSLWPASFTDKFTFSRTAYLALKLAPDPAAPDAMPRVVGIYRTRKMRIFNSSGTETAFQYSTNPADIYADLLVSAFVKPRGLIDEALTAGEKAFFDFAQLDTFRTDCNVSTPQSTTRFEAHPAFYSSTDLLRALELLFLLSRGYHLEKAEKFAPFMNKARSSLLTLGPNDFASGSFNLGERNTRDASNRYYGKFLNLDSGKCPGTIATTGTAATGTSTKFLKWFRAGSPVRLTDGAQAGQVRKVASVASDTSMTLTTAFSADQSGRLYSNPEQQLSKGFKQAEDETHQVETGRILTLDLDLHNNIPERAERIVKYTKAKALDVVKQTGLRALWIPGVLDLLPGDVFTSSGKWDFYDAANNQDWDLLKLVINQNMTFELGGEEYDAALYSDAAGAQQDIVPSLPGPGLAPITEVAPTTGGQYVTPGINHESEVREAEVIAEEGDTSASSFTTVDQFDIELSPLSTSFKGKLVVSRQAITQNGSNGPNAATAGSGWPTTPNNITASDDAYAVDPGLLGAPGSTLVATLPTPSLPSTALLVAVDITVECSRSAGINRTITDYSVKLRKSGSPVGPNKANGVAWGTTDSNQVYSWALADLQAAGISLADVNNGLVSFELVAQETTGTNAADAQVDYITVKWWYATYTMEGRLKIGALTSNVVSISNPTQASAATDVAVTGLAPATPPAVATVTIEVQARVAAGAGTARSSFTHKRARPQHRDHFV